MQVSSQELLFTLPNFFWLSWNRCSLQKMVPLISIPNDYMRQALEVNGDIFGAILRVLQNTIQNFKIVQIPNQVPERTTHIRNERRVKF